MSLKSALCKNLIPLISMLIISGSLFAHAVVKKNSLDERPVIAAKPTVVSLLFNSLIKPEKSKVFLINKNNKRSELTFSRSKQLGEILIQLPALIPGEYTLQYKILSFDGHMTEENLNFTVK